MKTLLINGKIMSCDADDKIYGSILFDRHSIIALEEGADQRLKFCSDINIIDLGGRTVLPGFIDCHNHLYCYGTAKLGIDFEDGDIKCLEDLFRAIRERGERLKNGAWLRVSNFDETRLEEKRRPSRAELDSVSQGFPVVILRKCLHELIANSVALKLAGVTENTSPPPGGVIQKNEGTGEPTGVLKDSAMDIVKDTMGAFSVDELADSLQLAYDEILSEGITTVHETGVGLMQSVGDEMQAFQRAREKGNLKVKTRLYILSKALQEMEALGLREGLGDDMLKIGGGKFYEDGAFSIHTAGLYEPYANAPEAYGNLLYEKEEILRELEICHRHKLQASVHAIGDRAIDEIIRCFEYIKDKYGWNDMRHRIEHFMIADSSYIDRARDCGIVVMSNPSELYFYGDSLAENLGMERAQRAYPVKSLIEKGVRLASGSDRPCGGGNPFVTIRTAIERKTRDGKNLRGKEAVTLRDGIDMWTKGAAYAEFAEDRKGTLEVGKCADLIVLDRDPYSLESSELTDIKVDFTFVNGEMCHNS